jgi:hypothetical protein
MNQQVVQAINYAAQYKPISDPFYLAAAYNKIAEGLKQPPDCFISQLAISIAILSVFMVVTMSRFLKLFVSKLSLSKTPVSNKSTCSLKVKTSKQKRKYTRRKQRLKGLPRVYLTLLATNHESRNNQNLFTMDTDGVPFIIDNSANGAICNTRSLFLGPFEQKNVTKVTAHGKTSDVMRVGTIRLKLRDDNGDEWTYDIPNVVFDPDSPYSLLGIPFLGEYFAKDNPNESRDEETWILSRSSQSQFTWDHGQHERHFVHGKIPYQN